MHPSQVMGTHTGECPFFLLVLNIASDLLGLDAFQLSEVLTQRSMILRGEEISSPLTVEQVSVLLYASVTSIFPGLYRPLKFKDPCYVPAKCSAVSSSLLPLIVVQVPALRLLLFRPHRAGGVHL